MCGDIQAHRSGDATRKWLDSTAAESEGRRGAQHYRPGESIVRVCWPIQAGANMSQRGRTVDANNTWASGLLL